MKNYLKKIAILFCLIVVLVSPIFVFAGPAFDNLQKVGEIPLGNADAPYAPSDENSLANIIRIVIQAFLGLLGVIFLILIIYSGYNWMTAQGDEQKVEKAKQTLQHAIIGLIIIVTAYSITYFVFSSLPNGEAGGQGNAVGGSPNY